MLVSNWHQICFFLFICYYFKNNGISSIFFPILIFLYFIVEEKLAGFFVWKLSFLYITALIICKFAISLNGLDIKGLNSIFSNNGESLAYEGILCFFIYVQIALLKKMGLYKNILTEVENIHMAYLRL